MEQRMKIDIILVIVGITFLAYSVLGGENKINVEAFRYLVGLEFLLGGLYCIISPKDKWR